MNRSLVAAVVVLLFTAAAFNLAERRRTIAGFAQRTGESKNPQVILPTAPTAQTKPQTTDMASALKPQQSEIVQLNNQNNYAEAMVGADKWLAAHPTDGLMMLERQRALAGTLKKQTISIGLSAPFTGALKQIGEAFAQGVALAVTEANAKGGVKNHWLEVQALNDAGDRVLAIKVASNFLNNEFLNNEQAAEKVLGVVGPYSSSTVLASSVIYNQGLAIVAPAATNPRVTGAGPYIYRVAPSDTQQGASLARLAKSKGAKNVAVLFDESDAYSKGLAEAFKEEAKFDGINTTDFQIQLNNIQDVTVGNYAVDAVLVAGYMSDVAAVAKLEANYPHKIILAGDGAYGQELLAKGGKAVNGVMLTTFFHAGAQDAGSKDFTRKFRARFGGGTPNANAMQAYDASRTIIEALRRAPSLSRQGLRAGLETFKNKPGPGVTAPVRFDSNGDVKDRPFVVVQVTDGKFEAVGLAP